MPDSTDHPAVGGERDVDPQEFHEQVEDWHGKATSGPTGELREPDPERDAIVLARARLHDVLTRLRFSGALNRPPTVTSPTEQGEAEWLDQVTAWIGEFKGVLVDVATTTEEMSQELQALRHQRRAVRELFGLADLDTPARQSERERYDPNY